MFITLDFVTLRLVNNYDKSLLKEIFNKLIKYVPYRFIRPWFYESIGIDDAKVNGLIISLQGDQFKTIPYTIDVKNNEIHLNENWFKWIYSNVKIIESFTLFELFKYVEKNNPYVTNISLKLFKPQLIIPVIQRHHSGAIGAN